MKSTNVQQNRSQSFRDVQRTCSHTREFARFIFCGAIRCGFAGDANRNTRKKRWPHKRSVHGLKENLMKGPDDMSGKGLTKAKVLVVHRIGFVRSGVLSLIAKSMQFAVCGETDERLWRGNYFCVTNRIWLWSD